MSKEQIMEVAIACFIVSALSLVPLVVLTVVDLVRTRRWVRTEGWAQILDAMMAGESAQAAALYAMYKKDLHWWQQVTVETHIDAMNKRVFERLVAAGWVGGERLGARPDDAWSVDAEVRDEADRDLDENTAPK